MENYQNEDEENCCTSKGHDRHPVEPEAVVGNQEDCLARRNHVARVNVVPAAKEFHVADHQAPRNLYLQGKQLRSRSEKVQAKESRVIPAMRNEDKDKD